MLVDEVSLVASKVVRFGVTRLEGSEAHSKQIQPTSKKTVRRPTLHKGAKFGLCILSMVILGGVFFMLRILYVDHANRQNTMSETVLHGQQTDLFAKPRNSDPWQWWHRYFCCARNMEDCDATHSSLISSVYSKKSLQFPTANHRYCKTNPKSQCSPTKQPFHNITISIPSMEPDSIYIVEPESIYIVESDDDEELDNPHAFQAKQNEYGEDPLSMRDLDLL